MKNWKTWMAIGAFAILIHPAEDENQGKPNEGTATSSLPAAQTDENNPASGETGLNSGTGVEGAANGAGVIQTGR